MNYGLSIIILSILDILVMFSGLPTGWKKAFILIISLAFLLIGWIIRTVEIRRKNRAKMRAESIEDSFLPELEKVAHTIAHDVSEHVEYEVQEIAETPEALHHHNQEESLFE